MITPLIDISGQCLKIRDQGQRNTCLAFALSSLHETNLQTKEYMSTEELHYFAKQRQGSFDSGVDLTYGVEALSKDGQSFDQLCPYFDVEPSISWKPPHSTEKYTYDVLQKTFDLGFVLEKLKAGLPIVIGIGITNQWCDMGEMIIDYDETFQVLGGHAVVLIGQGQCRQGTDYFKVRNSWGPEWGIGGYGWVSELYLKKMTIGIIT